MLRSAREPDAAGAPWWLTAMLGIAAAVCASIAIGIGTIYAFYSTYTSDYVPVEQKIQQRYVGLTEVYDRGGPESGTFLGSLWNPNAQLLNPVPLSGVSDYLIEATISTEDNNFWNNPGVDPKGILRAAWDNYAGGGIGSGSGGSTLTQQLVKNVYLSDDCSVVNGVRSCVAPRTLQRKLKEMALAIEVERHYSKQQILEWYFNQTSYAGRYVGAEAASRGYFHKSAADLDLAEAALLAGVPAAPTAYHPRLNCARDANNACIKDPQGRTLVAGAAKERQDQVLNLMVQHGRISRAEADAAIAEPIYVYPDDNPVVAAAWIDDQVEPRLVRMCEAGILPKIAGANDCTESVHNAGYKVTSTLDWAETQKATQMMGQFIQSGLAANCACHNASIVTIDPPSGQVMVYAPNVDPSYVSDPRVAGDIDQAVEINQPGSSFKPAVYLNWFQTLNKTPVSSIWDTSPLVVSDPNANKDNQVVIVDPRADGGNEGLITARLALGGSQNVPAFRAAEEGGVDNVIAMAKALGITTLDQGFDPTFYNHNAIHYGPSIATGGANVRVFDMAYMNATIANMGNMVGVPTLAPTMDMKSVLSLKTAKGDDYDRALAQKAEFQHGNIRLPGTRQLDPVVVLQVQSIDGKVLYQEGKDVQTIQVANPGNVWMLYSIQADCLARVIIWGCGSSNNDLSLDTFMPDGTKIPMGIKTGTQQGFTSANDTLATWMNGYSRYAATALWVGNADKSNVHDGPQWGYAAANTTVRLFKNWMSQYHADLQAKGVFQGAPAGFDEIRPANVAYVPYQTATTERGRRGGCSQMMQTWVRTDIHYLGDCQGKGYMPLPPYQTGAAIAMARSRGIPISGSGIAAVAGVQAPSTATPVPVQTPVPTQATQPSNPPPARTQPPATRPPATQPPATQPPATQPPRTRPPATAPPPTAQATSPPGNATRAGR